MRSAVVQDRYGPPEALTLRGLPMPEVGPRDVLVRVHAAVLHPGDVFVAQGRPYLMRLAFGLRRPGRGVPGRDIAVTVEAVGARVEALAPGDAVFGWTATGSLAEYVAAPAARLVDKVPAGVSMAQAAALPTSGLTALQAWRDVARLRPGQRVLVVGASGGVGHFAVQIAKALGAHVTAGCSAANLHLARGLGADVALDYAVEDAPRRGTPYDAILDDVEARPLAEMRRILAPDGTLIPNTGCGPCRASRRPGSAMGSRASGRVVPVVGRTYPLADAAAALAHVAAGHARGKVVVAVA